MLNYFKKTLSVYNNKFRYPFLILFLHGYLISRIKDSLNIDYSLVSLSGILFILFDFIFIWVLLVLVALILKKINDLRQ
ncbi:hypothetical protein IGK47_000059 [Enterococcus sp. AZ007]